MEINIVIFVSGWSKLAELESTNKIQINEYIQKEKLREVFHKR